MALDAITAIYRFGVELTGQKNVTGLHPRLGKSTFSQDISFSLGAGAGAANEIHAAVYSINASSSTEIDLSAALLNIVGDTSITLARIKALLVWLLSSTQSVGTGSAKQTGNACTSITIGAAAAQQWNGPLGGNTHTLTIHNGNGFMVTRNDATGWVVTSGSVDTLKIANNDGSVAAKVFLALAGAAT